MKRTYIFGVLILFFVSCKKEKIDLQRELQEGAWRVTKVEKSNDVILSGENEPLLLFFFKENEEVTGRLKGTYRLSENKHLYFQVAINPYVPIFRGRKDSLANFPQRYYDFEAITKNGIEGTIEFFENGFDSQFSLQYEQDKKMWFQRY